MNPDDLRPGRIVWYNDISFTASMRIRNKIFPTEFIIKEAHYGTFYTNVSLVDIADSEHEIYLGYIRNECVDDRFSTSYSESALSFNKKIDDNIERVQTVLSTAVQNIENSAFTYCDLSSLPPMCRRTKLEDIWKAYKGETSMKSWGFSFYSICGLLIPTRVSAFSRYRIYGTLEDGGEIDVAVPYGKHNYVPLCDYGGNVTTTLYPTAGDLYLDLFRDQGLLEKKVEAHSNNLVNRLEKLKIQ